MRLSIPKAKLLPLASRLQIFTRKLRRDKGTQLVFLDLGTPKAKEKEPEYDKDGNVINEESDETADEAKLLTDVYRNVKSALIAGWSRRQGYRVCSRCQD